MDSNVNPLAPGAELLHYKLAAKLDQKPGGNVWSADDTKLGRQVALKVLSRSFTADSAQRDAVIRSLRLAAAVRHPNLITIRDIASSGGTLFIVMELVAGDNVRGLTSREALGRDQILSAAFQIASAVTTLHEGGVIHGNLTDESVIMRTDGMVKVGGFGLHSVSAKDTPPGRSWQSASPDSLSFVSPERLTGAHPDPKADIYAIGALLYQLSTGHHLYEGSTVSEVAEKITRGQPVSPKTFNPEMGDDLVKVIGRSVFKDAAKRYGSVDLILADIEAIAPALRQKLVASTAALSASQERPVVVEAISQQPTSVPRKRVLLAADGGSPAARQGGSSTLQILGESIYLFDGKVLDPLAEVVVAEMPGASAAMEAARNAVREIDERGKGHLPFRMVVFAGETGRSGVIDVMEATQQATRLLKSIEGNEVWVASEVWPSEELHPEEPSATFEGISFRSLKSAEVIESAELTPVAPVPVQEPAALKDGTMKVHQPAKRAPWLAVGVAAVVILAAAGWFLFSGKVERGAPVTSPTMGRATALPAVPSHQLYFEPIMASGGGGNSTIAATNLRRAVIEIFRDDHEVDVVSDPLPDANRVTFRPGQGSTWIPSVTSPRKSQADGPAMDLSDVQSALQTSIGLIANAAGVRPPAIPATGPGLTAFVEAASLYESADAQERSRGVAAVRRVISADSSFLPAHRLAMVLYSNMGSQADLMSSAARVVELDPSNIQALRALADANFRLGRVSDGIAALARALERSSADNEALERLASYCVGAGDTSCFQRLAAKFPKGMKTSLHEPDLLMAEGGVDAAATKYYELEAIDPQNATLAMKIGRIAVFRRSNEIANLELEKIDRIEPGGYRSQLLRAYIAAGRGDSAGAETRLAQAGEAADRGKDFFTSSADIYAMLNRPAKVIASIEKSIMACEPTPNYLLHSRLFGYLATDARFMQVRKKLEAARESVRSALAAAKL